MRVTRTSIVMLGVLVAVGVLVATARFAEADASTAVAGAADGSAQVGADTESQGCSAAEAQAEAEADGEATADTGDLPAEGDLPSGDVTLPVDRAGDPTDPIENPPALPTSPSGVVDLLPMDIIEVLNNVKSTIDALVASLPVDLPTDQLPGVAVPSLPTLPPADGPTLPEPQLPSLPSGDEGVDVHAGAGADAGDGGMADGQAGGSVSPNSAQVGAGSETSEADPPNPTVGLNGDALTDSLSYLPSGLDVLP